MTQPNDHNHFVYILAFISRSTIISTCKTICIYAIQYGRNINKYTGVKDDRHRNNRTGYKEGRDHYKMEEK